MMRDQFFVNNFLPFVWSFKIITFCLMKQTTANKRFYEKILEV